MKTPIKTSQGTFTSDAVSRDLIVAKFKPQIWPEVMLRLTEQETEAVIHDLGKSLIAVRAIARKSV